MKGLVTLFWRILRDVVLVLFFCSVIPCLYITVIGLNDDLHTADVAVVLGNKVEPDGTPSEMLKARLDHTVELYQQDYFKLILVSGAHGKEGYDEPAVMRQYLEARAIPHDAIVEDNEGYTTWDTAKNTARFLRDRNLTSVLVISQYFHLPRCQLAFAKFGIDPVYTSHAPFWSLHDFYSVPREVIAYAVYYFRPVKVTASPPHSK